MAWLEGAIRKEVKRHRTPMARYDGVCEHIAVSNGLSLYTFFNQDGNATSHFYVRKAGPQGQNAGMADFEQYVDTRFRAPANLEGNHRLISVETQGGVGSDLNNGWTVAQLNRLAWIAAECHRLHGIPLQAMPNSLPTSRGIGYHRLGIDPWRVSGGEYWSKSRGKVCPGDARIKQIPQIITLARKYTQEDEMTPAQMTELKNFIETTVQRYSAFNAKNLTQQLNTLLANFEEIEQTYAVAVNNYTRQDGDVGETAILNALADGLTALKAQLTALQTDVDKLEEAEAANHPKG